MLPAGRVPSFLVLARLRGSQPSAEPSGVIEIRRCRDITLAACQVLEAGATPPLLEDVRSALIHGCILRQASEDEAPAVERRAIRVSGACANVRIVHSLVEGEIDDPHQGLTLDGTTR